MQAQRKEPTTEIGVVVKAWEIVQALAKANGESAWKVRSWAVTIWAALVAFAYTADKTEIIVVAMVILCVSLLVEMAVRQVEYGFIARSIEIEECLNNFLAGDELSLPSKGVSTNIDTPSIAGLFGMLGTKRWLVWFPYLVLLICSVVIIQLR